MISMLNMTTIRTIVGKQWFDFKGKEINDPIVIIEECGDFHPFKDGPVFKGTHIACFDWCDKNFIYYWMKPEVFPDLKTIYLNSHPCESKVFYRFKDATIYLDTRYQRYKDRWADHRESVIVRDINPKK